MDTKMFVLDQDMKCVGVLDNSLPKGCPFFDDVHTESLEHALLTLEFKVPASHSLAEAIEPEGFIVYPNMDNRNELFQIKEVTETNQGGQYVKSVYAENAAVSDLIGTVVRPVTLNSYTVEQAVNYVLTGTGWRVGNTYLEDTKDVVFDDYTNALEALHKVMDVFGCEIEWFVKFDGLKVTDKIVQVWKQRGTETRKVFTYGIDLVSVERTEDTKELYTALVGLSNGDGYANYLSLRDYTGSVPEGYELVDDWLGSLEALQRYGRNGKHIFGIYRFDGLQNATELFNKTLEKLKEVSKPRLNYKVDVALLERLTGYEAHKVRLGDTIIVKDTTFKPDLVLEARVLELKRSKTDPSQDSVTLGEFKKIIVSPVKQLQQLQAKLMQYEAVWTNGADTAQQALTTANTALSTANTAQSTATQAQTTAEQAQDAANTAQTTADQAQNTANQVKSTVDSWRHTTDTTKIDGGQIYTGSITADKLTTGQNPNMMQRGYDSFEQIPVGDFGSIAGGTAEYAKIEENTYPLDGKRCLRVRGGATGSSHFCYLGTSSSDYHIPVIAGQTYIASCFCYNPNYPTTTNVRISVVTAKPGDGTVTPVQVDGAWLNNINKNNGWQRIYVRFTVPTNHTHAIVRVEHTANSISTWFDAFQFELVNSTQTQPGGWRPAGTTVIEGGSIRGGTLTLGGAGNGYGRLIVLRDDETPVAQLDAQSGGFDTLYVGDLESPSVVPRNISDYTIYVDPVNGSAANSGLNGWSDALPSLQAAFDIIPKYNEGTITILVSSTAGTWTEGEIYLKGVGGSGQITIDFNTPSNRANTLIGRLFVLNVSNYVLIQNGTIKNQETWQSNYYYGCLYATQSSRVHAKNMYFDARAGSKLAYCVVSTYNSYVRVEDCEAYNGATAQLISAYGSHIETYNTGCIGSGGQYGVYVVSATAGGYGKAPQGSSANVKTDYGGICNATYDFNYTPTAPGAPATQTYTYTWSATATKSYRTTYGWRTDNNNVYQGDYGYGNHKGLAFFNYADIQSKLAGKTIKSVSLYMERIAGGTNSAQYINLYTHNYASQPGGDPTITLVKSNAAAFAVGDKKWVSIPTSVGTALRDGTAKGIAIYASSGSPYMIFGTNVKLQIKAEG